MSGQQVVTLTRKDGATVHVVAAPALSRLGQPNGVAAETIKSSGASSVVLQLDPARQSFLDSDYYADTPCASSALNSYAGFYFNKQLDNATKIGLVPYGDLRDAVSAAAETGAAVHLGDRDLARGFERLPFYKVAGAFFSNEATALLDRWRGEKDKEEFDRAAYVWDHPTIRSKILKYAVVDRDVPGIARAALGDSAYSALVTDSAKAMIATINEAKGPVVVAVTNSFTHQREIASLWEAGKNFDQKTIDAVNAPAGFFDRNYHIMAGLVIVAGVVGLRYSRRPGPAAAWHKTFERHAKTVASKEEARNAKAIAAMEAKFLAK